MGELNISITDLSGCTSCGSHTPMIFQDKNDKWFVSCGRKIQCGTETKHHKELLDAASEWGLKESS